MWHIFRISVLLTVSLNVGSTLSTQESQITVYWNVPTFLCKSHKVNFETTLQQFKIKHNLEDKFRGETISIFYNPGEFPTVEKRDNDKNIQKNGGIPQLGSIEMHLTALEESLKQELPVGFSGLGVIDFEEWRPIFRQNWNKQVIYKELSVDWSKTKNSNLLTDNDKILEAAEKGFEKAATEFMKETLGKAKSLFPQASWGFYGFPHCYNHYSDDITQCAEGVIQENDRIQEIFNKSDALFPSIYMNETMSREDKKNLVLGRVKEAERVWKKRNINQEAFTLPYMWVRYLDSDNYLSENDIKDSLETIKTQNAKGVIIWGRSEDVKTKEKCQKLHTFLEGTLGPAIKDSGI